MRVVAALFALAAGQPFEDQDRRHLLKLLGKVNTNAAGYERALKNKASDLSLKYQREINTDDALLEDLNVAIQQTKNKIKQTHNQARFLKNKMNNQVTDVENRISASIESAHSTEANVQDQFNQAKRAVVAPGGGGSPVKEVNDTARGVMHFRVDAERRVKHFVNFIQSDIKRIKNDFSIDRANVEDMYAIFGAAIRGQYKTLAPAAKEMHRAVDNVFQYIDKTKAYINDTHLELQGDITGTNGLSEDKEEMKTEMQADLEKERTKSTDLVYRDFDKGLDKRIKRWEDLDKDAFNQHGASSRTNDGLKGRFDRMVETDMTRVTENINTKANAAFDKFTVKSNKGVSQKLYMREAQQKKYTDEESAADVSLEAAFAALRSTEPGKPDARVDRAAGNLKTAIEGVNSYSSTMDKSWGGYETMQAVVNNFPTEPAEEVTQWQEAPGKDTIMTAIQSKGSAFNWMTDDAKILVGSWKKLRKAYQRNVMTLKRKTDGEEIADKTREDTEARLVAMNEKALAKTLSSAASTLDREMLPIRTRLDQLAEWVPDVADKYLDQLAELTRQALDSERRTAAVLAPAKEDIVEMVKGLQKLYINREGAVHKSETASRNLMRHDLAGVLDYTASGARAATAYIRGLGRYIRAAAQRQVSTADDLISSQDSVLSTAHAKFAGKNTAALHAAGRRLLVGHAGLLRKAAELRARLKSTMRARRAKAREVNRALLTQQRRLAKEERDAIRDIKDGNGGDVLKLGPTSESLVDDLFDQKLLHLGGAVREDTEQLKADTLERLGRVFAGDDSMVTRHTQELQAVGAAQVASMEKVKQEYEPPRVALKSRVAAGEADIADLVAEMTGAAKNQSEWAQRMTGKLHGAEAAVANSKIFLANSRMDREAAIDSKFSRFNEMLAADVHNLGKEKQEMVSQMMAHAKKEAKYIVQHSDMDEKEAMAYLRKMDAALSSQIQDVVQQSHGSDGAVGHLASMRSNFSAETEERMEAITDALYHGEERLSTDAEVKRAQGVEMTLGHVIADTVEQTRAIEKNVQAEISTFEHTHAGSAEEVTTQLNAATNLHSRTLEVHEAQLSRDLDKLDSTVAHEVRNFTALVGSLHHSGNQFKDSSGVNVQILGDLSRSTKRRFEETHEKAKEIMSPAVHHATTVLQYMVAAYDHLQNSVATHPAVYEAMLQRAAAEMQKEHWQLLHKIGDADRGAQAIQAENVYRQAKLAKWGVANAQWQQDVQKGIDTLKEELASELAGAAKQAAGFNQDLSSAGSALSADEDRRMREAMAGVDSAITDASGASEGAKDVVSDSLRTTSRGSDAASANADGVVQGAFGVLGALTDPTQLLGLAVDNLAQRAGKAEEAEDQLTSSKGRGVVHDLVGTIGNLAAQTGKGVVAAWNPFSLEQAHEHLRGTEEARALGEHAALAAKHAVLTGRMRDLRARLAASGP